MRLRRTAAAATVRPAEGTATAVLGVLGRPWRAVALADGTFDVPGGEPLAWAIVAEDRVHTPAASPTRRTRLVDGAPVHETALRLPGGDVVVTVFAVADGGGALVVDVANGAANSVAFAFGRPDAVTPRPALLAPDGAPVPAGWRTLPLAHGGSLRIAVPAPGVALDAVGLAALPAAEAVVRGWQRQLDGGAQLDLPDTDVDERLLRSRSQRCLAAEPSPLDEPAAWLRRAGALATVGFSTPVEVDDVAAAVEALAKGLRRAAATPWDDAGALLAAHRTLVALGEDRAAADLVALADRLPPPSVAPDDAPADDERYEAWLTARLAVAHRGTVRLLPSFPKAWLGVNLSAYEVPTLAGPAGFAVRWHGARPALLWQTPDGVAVACPGLDPAWSTVAAGGEALLAEPT